jgi:hypothetical protein
MKSYEQAMPKISEWALQRALVIWLDGNPDRNGNPRVRPALAPNVVYFHVPNGGNRDAREGARFREIGVKAGVPDLIFLAYQRFYLMELKEPGGPQPPTRQLSSSQEKMHPRLIAAGATSLVTIDNLVDAKAWTIQHGLAFPV